MQKPFFVSTPIYYVNSKPHVGHAYTTLATDVLARYYRILGREVFFLTGADEHGAKICQAAQKSGQDPQVFCDEVSGLFKQAWQNLNIDYSYFIRTTNKEHKEKVRDFLTVLKDKGFLYEGEYSGNYCMGCEKFITEKELVNGECPDHKCAPEKISEKNWFFKLKQFLPLIERLIKEDKIKVRPESAKAETLGLLGQDLDDISVSRQNVSWGIKLPWDERQTVYVWVDALLNYWTAVQQKGREHYWPPDLHLIAKDILKFHCVYWPALLLAYGLKESDLPKQIFVHGYFTVNGQKMSKTIGNVIDPNDLIAKYDSVTSPQVGIDATRYLLLSQFPFGNDGDISLARLDERYNSDLANGLGNLVGRVVILATKLKTQMSLASPAGGNVKSTSQNLKLRDEIQRARHNYEAALEGLKFNEALSAVWELIGFCDKYVNDERPWENGENAKQVVAELLVALKEIAALLRPFMPQTSEKILRQIETGASQPLFPRIVA